MCGVVVVVFLQFGSQATETYKEEFLVEYVSSEGGLFGVDLFSLQDNFYFDDVALDGSVPYELAPLSQKASLFYLNAGLAMLGPPIDDTESLIALGATIYGDGPTAFSFDVVFGAFDLFDTTETIIRAGLVTNNFPTVFTASFMYYNMDDAGTKYTNFELSASVMHYNPNNNVAFSLEIPIDFSDDFGDAFGLNPGVTVYVTEQFGLNLGLDITFPKGADTALDFSVGFSLSSDKVLLSLGYEQSIEPNTYLTTLSMALGFKY